MKNLIFLFAIFCLGSSRILAQDVTFRATSEKTVVVNQQFRVNYTLSTPGQDGKNMQLGDIKNLELLYGPVVSQQGSSTSIINGKMSSSSTTVFTCVFMAKSEGTFTIPPATIAVGNSTYKSNDLTVKVLPADQAAAAASQNNIADQADQQQQVTGASASNKDLFVVMNVSKNSVYENEGFLVTFKLYFLVDVTGFENVKFPEFEGFISQEIDLGKDTQMNLESYNGRNYRTAIIKQTILFPQHSGQITIGSGKFDVIARIRSQQRVHSIFNDFLDTYSDVKKTLTSAPVTINVKPLPTERPASFSGAVGNYTMTSSINSQNVKTNDAVTIKVAISGTGNIKLIANPKIVFPNDFEVYDPTVDVKTKITQSGVTGTKAIDYNAIPRYAGDFTIPKAEFSYFDLSSGTYKTLTTEEYKLHVAQGPAGSGTAPIVNATNKEDIRFLGKDILYIKTDNYNFHKGSFFFGTFGYYLWYIIPALLFIVLFIIYRKQAAENANIALVRTKKANKVASKRLKAAAKYLNENKKEAFYDETLRAVWGYLSDKLNIPVSALTKDNVEANLTQYGVDENLINDFRNILDTAEFARFAPAEGSGTMSELYNSTIQAIDKMENTIKK